MTHVFASPLQRAHKTALAVCAAQTTPIDDSASSSVVSSATPLSIVKVAQLVEQDFGFYEGKPFYARPRDSSKTGREAHYETHKSEPGFVDVESRTSLAERCDNFLDNYLLPVFEVKGSDAEQVVVIVSHGILLSNLWRRLLLRLPQKSVTVVPEILASKGQVVLEHLGGWSNTGFLELTIRLGNASTILSKSGGTSAVLAVSQSANEDIDTTGLLPACPSDEVGTVEIKESEVELHDQSQPLLLPLPVQRRLEGYLTTILTIDGKEHLKGFKRTRGGIGRAEHDEKQKTVDSFFKRAKKE